jgi:hypothetical protein
VKSRISHMFRRIPENAGYGTSREANVGVAKSVVTLTFNDYYQPGDRVAFASIPRLRS